MAILTQMKNTLLLFAAILLVNSAEAVPEDERGIVISTLFNKEKLLVKYTYSGCFGYEKYELLLEAHPEKDTVTATIIKIEPDLDYEKKQIEEMRRTKATSIQTFKEKSRTSLGTVMLNERDLMRLENLFRYYQNAKHTGACTTSIRVELVRDTGSKLIFVGSYEDDSCGLNEHRRLEIMTFQELEARARQFIDMTARQQ